VKGNNLQKNYWGNFERHYAGVVDVGLKEIERN
jgi:hypothetical protein